MTKKEHIEKVLYELKPLIESKYEPLGLDFMKVKNIILESKIIIDEYNISNGISRCIYYMIEIEKVIDYYFTSLMKQDTEEGLDLEISMIDKYRKLVDYILRFKKANLDENMKEKLVVKVLNEYDGKKILSTVLAKEIVIEIGKNKMLTKK